MARKILNLPEELSDEQKAKLLNKDIPYRVELLRMVSKIPLPASQLTDKAGVEAALIIGRQLMGFLGLGIDFRDDRERTFLVECTWYDRFKRQGQKYTHEVKVTDLGGSFLSPCKFTTNEKSTLAEFYYGASKATAHLTVGSEHKLDPRLFREGCQLIADTTERILGDLAQLSS